MFSNASFDSDYGILYALLCNVLPTALGVESSEMLTQADHLSLQHCPSPGILEILGSHEHHFHFHYDYFKTPALRPLLQRDTSSRSRR